MSTILMTHKDILEKLSEIDGLLLNLRPTGILFNGPYLKKKIDNLGKTITTHSSMEDAILELLGIYLK
jgi:hypothetical protein